MFELTYIYHDCFLFVNEACAIVFDFWKDPSTPEGKTPDFMSELPGELPLYVFVSHFHKDHFNREIFRWVEVHPNIRFIISKDTYRHASHLLREGSLYKGERPDRNLVTILQKGENYRDEVLCVQAYGSTDVGNSYAITLAVSGLTIFHAGDLNCWTWRDESSEEEIEEAEKSFEAELKPIRKDFKGFDIVMFPVDSRIGTGYAEGASKFLSYFEVSHFFPMHFELGDSDEELMKLKQNAADFETYARGDGELIALTSRGDRYVMEKEDNDIKRPVFDQEFFLSAGEANAESELSLPILTSKLIDIATAHANHLGIGNPDMPNNHSGWVLSRLTIEMNEYPIVDSSYRIFTWVESWNRHFSERSFRIDDAAGNVMGYARSIWMVLDTKTRANAGLDSLPMKNEYIPGIECPIKKQGKHFALVPPQESDAASGKYLGADPKVDTHTFLYSDLDAYRHVNTVRYVSLLMNQFPLEEHDSYNIGRLELSFLQEGQYDRPLEILRATIPSAKEGSKGFAFQLRHSDDKSPILFARLWLDRRGEADN